MGLAGTLEGITGAVVSGVAERSAGDEEFLTEYDLSFVEVFCG